MKQGMTAEDLYQLKFVSDPELSPNGEKVAYTVKKVNESKKYESHLYLSSLRTGTSKQWTRGSHNDTYPRWSPDGKQLAFVSDRSGNNQIWLISAEGGEAKRLTNNETGASAPVWSPDGRTLIITSTIKKDAEEKEELQPLEVTKLQYKADGKGLLKGEFAQLFLLDIETQKQTQVTSCDCDHFDVAWSPDGKSIAYSKSRPNEDTVSYASDLVIRPLDGEETVLPMDIGSFTDAVWSPCGEYVAYFGQTFEHGSATLGDLYVCHVKSEEVVCLTIDFDEHAGDAVVGDMHFGHPGMKPVWSREGEGLYFIASLKGSTSLHYATLNGEISQISERNSHLYGYSLDVEHDVAVFAESTPVLPGDLFTASLSQFTDEVNLTNVNEEWLSRIALSQPEEFTFVNDEGYSVQSWLLKPPGFEKGKKYPLILEIHGGPHAMYGNTFFQELQMLAAAGNVVLYSNPRGSYGYGQQFVKACMGDYGGGDYRDLMAALDYALEYDFIDGEQLGVTGGSYGGFMTNWIIGHTSKFKAAVTQRSISNWLSFQGVSDIGFYFTKWEIGSHLFEDPEKLWQHSPIRLSSRMNTPLLILHGEEDHRCPIEQAEQLFIALKQQDKNVKFVRFPNADHNLSRSGDPSLRVARLNYISGWFKELLKDAPEEGGVPRENTAIDRV